MSGTATGLSRQDEGEQDMLIRRTDSDAKEPNIVSAVRERYGMTRKELADSLGLGTDGQGLVKQWEEGTTAMPNGILSKMYAYPVNPPLSQEGMDPKDFEFTFIDLFAGIGGIRQAFQNQGGLCVWTSEIDPYAQKTYRANFGGDITGDITKVDASTIPDFDIVLAGFPCQAFSMAGHKKGFEDSRGTLFFDVARIIKEKRPKAVFLENVKNLMHHDKGRTIQVILGTLDELGYEVPSPRVLDAWHFGIPQHRERTLIVGFRRDLLPDDAPEFEYPAGQANPSCKVGDILQPEGEVNEKYTLKDGTWEYLQLHKERARAKGHGFGFTTFTADSPHTNTISARYYKDGSEALIDREDGQNPRRLTPRECARLQGFPDEFVIPVSDARAYKQFGNSVCIPMIEAVAKAELDYMRECGMM